MSTPDNKQVWLVTGCSSGIGASLAQLLHQSSNPLIATSRFPSQLSSLPSNDPLVLKTALDLSSPASVASVFVTANSRFGHVDVVVNNAGYGIIGDAEGTEPEEARKVFEVNYWGAVNVTLAAVRAMRESGRGGVIVMVSSFLGSVGFEGNAFYAASKFALEGFTESLSRELPSSWNIQLQILSLGGVHTSFSTNTSYKSQLNAGPHPAYDHANPANELEGPTPTQAIKAYLKTPQSSEGWMQPSVAAAAIVDVVRLKTGWRQGKAATAGTGADNGGEKRSEGASKKVPLRLPLGKDSWGILSADVAAAGKELGEWKEWSERWSGEVYRG